MAAAASKQSVVVHGKCVEVAVGQRDELRATRSTRAHNALLSLLVVCVRRVFVLRVSLGSGVCC